MDGQQNLRGAAKEPMWSTTFFLLCFANFTTFVTVYLLLPTLPIYLLEIGGAQRDVGFVMGAYTIGATAMRAVSGWLSDHYGRKPIMIVGLFAMLAVTTLYWVARDVSFVAVIRCLHGIGFGIAGTAIGTLVADSLPAVRMAEGLGYFGLTVPLAMGVAPMTGIWLAHEFGFLTLFVVVTVVMMITLLSSLAVKTAGQKSLRSGSPGLSDLVEKTALLPSLVIFLITLTTSSLLYFIALYALDLRIPNIGWFFAVNSVCIVVSRPLTGRWADRGRSNTVVLIGSLSLFAGMITVGCSHLLTGLLVAGGLVGLGSGFLLPTLQAIVVRHVPSHRRGAATGTYFLAYDMGYGLGAIVWGITSQALGYRSMYLLTPLPLILAGAVYYRFFARR
jgi:MFS family permease